MNNDASEGSYTVTVRMSGITVSTPPADAPDIQLAYIDTAGKEVVVPNGGSDSRAPSPVGGGEIGLAYIVGNVGHALLKVSAASVSNPVNCSPKVSFTPAAINPGNGTDVKVTDLKATVPGSPVSFTLVVTSDDPDEPVYTINVTVTSAVPNIYADMEFAGDVYLSDGDPRRVMQFRVFNTGGAPLHVSDIHATRKLAAEVIGVDPPTMTIAPGDSLLGGKLTFEAKTPEAEYGDYSFNLTFVSDNPDQGLFVLPVKGKVFKHNGDGNEFKETPGSPNQGRCGVSREKPQGSRLPLFFALLGVAACARRRASSRGRS